jgi:2-polyprenyl-3-methyl-5-hydroxy-6-metoxy-1,4-benzoquinol methylase
MGINTTYRINAPEVMDDFTLEGELLRDALDKIAHINRLLGGNKVTLQGVQKLISGISGKSEITIVDIGCGNGDMLRALSDYGVKNRREFRLIGVDANRFTVNYANELSVDYPNIRYQCLDVFDNAFENIEYDILLATLTLHHFKDNEILKLLESFKKNAKIGIVINDLQRSRLAYRLFQAVCFVFRLNDMSREDGLISILRGFKKKELIRFSEKLNFKKYTIQWKWAFRYQWIISNI